MSGLLPSLIRVRFADGALRWPSLWIPVFLLWPLWLGVLLVFFAVLWLGSLSTEAGSAAAAFRAVCGLHVLACSLRGGQCEIRAKGRELSVSIV
jgi:hypothetical protein